MYKTTVRERPERQPDRFNVTFKRCSQGGLSNDDYRRSKR